MRRPTACGFAIMAATSFAISMPLPFAQAQSLFNNRTSPGQSQASGPSTTGSLFSSNTGFPKPANANAAQGAFRAFVGRSIQGFVGRGAAGQSSSGGEVGNAGRRAEPTRRVDRAATGGEAAPQPASRQAETGSNRVRLTTIVPRHRIAFEFVAREPTAIGVQLQAQLANLAVRNPDFAKIRVQVDVKGRVTLQGHVPSDNTRKLAAIMVSLEPGVRTVHNELTVESDRD